MPSTTTKGYPYPVGTDRVADGDNAIQALAEKVDTALGVAASGTAVITFTAANNASVAVTFPVGRFTVAPAVMVTAQNSSYFCAALGATAAGVNLWGRQYAGTAVTAALTVSWLAVQV